MSAKIVVCPCGLRLKAKELPAGKSGTCPGCGRRIRVAEPAAAAPPAASPSATEDEWSWTGTYDLTPDESAQAAEADDEPFDRRERWPDELDGWGMSPLEPAPSEPAMDEEERVAGDGYDLSPDAPTLKVREPLPADLSGDVTPVVTDGVVPTPEPARRKTRPKSAEPWWPPRLGYPKRSAESLACVLWVGLASWILATLVPEYCLLTMADAEKLGASMVGQLFAVISALPAVVLFPLVATYWLQYLGRVLAASGDGDPRPPRLPDRNFDGLFGGMSSWFLWGALGMLVGNLPVLAYGISVWYGAAWNAKVAVALGVAGAPYVVMALLIVFLHDNPLAATPRGVLGALTRVGPSFLGLCLTLASIGGLMIGAFAAALALRSVHFWIYAAAMLGAWCLAVWSSIVAMHTLGCYYHPRARHLKWRHERSRWGAPPKQ
jgi:hypothetical protein